MIPTMTKVIQTIENIVEFAIVGIEEIVGSNNDLYC